MANSTDQLRIFLSHSSADHALAVRVAAELRRGDADVFLAPDSIPPGADYRDAIMRSLEECTHVVALLSLSSIQSIHVQRELSEADDHHYPILPFSISPLKYPDDYPRSLRYQFKFIQIKYLTDPADIAEAALAAADPAWATRTRPLEGAETKSESVRPVADDGVDVSDLWTGMTAPESQKRADHSRTASDEIPIQGKPSRHLTATGSYLRERDVVRVNAGSQMSMSEVSSIPAGARAQRAALMTDGRAADAGDAYVLTEDVEFKSPSAAACVLTGSSRSGNSFWTRISDGAALGDILSGSRPVESQQSPSAPVEAVPAQTTTSIGPGTEVIGQPRRGLQATAYLRPDESTRVVAGSQMSKVVNRAMIPSTENLRAELIESGRVRDDGDHYTFVSDYTFRSPSAAASALAGSSESGPRFWAHRDGTTLTELRKRRMQELRAKARPAQRSSRDEP